MKSSSSKIKLIAVGDLMLGDHPVCIGHGIRSTIDAKGFNFITDEIKSRVQNADISFGNLESVLSDYNFDPDSLASTELRGRPLDASNLSAVGFNLLNVANNHSMQHGLKAFEETIDLLSKEKIDIIGLDFDGDANIIIKEKYGINLAFVGYSLRPEKYCKTQAPYALSNEEKILRQINKIVENFYGPIIVSLHWGEEYLNYPSKKQMLFAHKLINSGVSLILGHHPHVLQGIEKYKNGVIVYSLGNFIFDKWQKNLRETIIFSCAFSNNEITDYSYEPIYITRKYRLTIACGKVKERIIKKIKTYNNMLDRVISEDDIFADEDQYLSSAKNAYQKFRMQSYLYFIMHIYKYDPTVILSSALRFVRRRIGME